MGCEPIFHQNANPLMLGYFVLLCLHYPTIKHFMLPIPTSCYPHRPNTILNVQVTSLHWAQQGLSNAKQPIVSPNAKTEKPICRRKMGSRWLPNASKLTQTTGNDHGQRQPLALGTQRHLYSADLRWGFTLRVQQF